MAANFTPRSQQVLALARKEADRLKHTYVGSEHLLLGIAALFQGTAANVLQTMGVDLNVMREKVESAVESGGKRRPVGNIPYTPRVKKVLAHAGKEAKALDHAFVGTEHLLLGILREGDGLAARVLGDLGIELDRTRVEVCKELDPNWKPGDEDEAAETPESLPKAMRCDVTAQARFGTLKPVVGREDEITRLIQILFRQNANNALLVGENGIGKAAIVEELARRIVEGDVPEPLREAKIVELDLSALPGSCRDPEKFSEWLLRGRGRLSLAATKAIVWSPHLCLTWELSQLLCSILRLDDVQGIGAMTPANYSEWAGDHPELAESFQILRVPKLNEADALAQVRRLLPQLEAHHCVHIREDALEAAVKLSAANCRTAFFPERQSTCWMRLPLGCGSLR